MIIIMLIKRKKPSFFTLWELNGSSFEQTWIPFIQGCTVAGLVEIGPLDFLKFRQSSFEQIWVPPTKGCIVPSLVEIDPVVLAKKMKMWKVYANDDNDDDDDDGQRTNFDQKSLLEPSAKKVSLNY